MIPGDKVVFSKPDVGLPMEVESARRYLTEGAVYIVRFFDDGSLYLDGFQNNPFNPEMFELITTKPENRDLNAEHQCDSAIKADACVAFEIAAAVVDATFTDRGTDQAILIAAAFPRIYQTVRTRRYRERLIRFNKAIMDEREKKTGGKDG